MTKKRPLILVTNDDGYNAKGIKALIEVASTLGEVLVVAPDKPQSGMGHAITVNGILRLHPIQYDFASVKAFSCTGTPVDCVKLAIYKVLHKKPDLVLSGVNHGANNSINVLYSGTMSAAMEGAIEGIPSIGFSLLDYSAEADFEHCKTVIDTITQDVIKNGMAKGTCLNVNIPKAKEQAIKGIKVCRGAKASWEDAFESRTDPFGKEYFWMKGAFVNHDKGQDTDVWALENNFVSVVPVHFDLTAHHEILNLVNRTYASE
ncbi:MAG: 5'/3'-nucleotidase SurE [Luteibaculaceae bacterium]